MPNLYDYRIFISHAWKYGADYDKLVNLLNKALYFNYYNYSAPEQKPLFPPGTPLNNEKIANAITNKIARAQITIVISGMYVQYKDWIQYEIDESVRMGKPILAVIPRGNQRIPSYVYQNADEIVGWSTSSIVAAIRRLVK